MKPERVALEEVADGHNLYRSFARAAAGKRRRADVETFRDDLDRNLACLAAEIQSETVQPLPMLSFRINHPKPRIIHAPQFRDRVLHHALIGCIGPVLDRSLIDDTYACRAGKGPQTAVRKAARVLARAPWIVQIDITQYFPSIDHGVLMSVLSRRVRGRGVLGLVERILRGHGSGKGLPIGALTSQVFANAYLGSMDRLVAGHPACRGYHRYMDDMLWGAHTYMEAEAVLSDAATHVSEGLRLRVKPGVKIRPAVDGVTFCGSRILPGRVLLTRRQRRKTVVHWRAAEADFQAGVTSAATLQKRIDSILAPVRHAEARSWRLARSGASLVPQEEV